MLRVKYFESLYVIMWDDDFYRFFRKSNNGRRMPYNFFNLNDSHSFDFSKIFDNFDTDNFSSYPLPDKYKFKATKYVSITVAEGDDEGIDQAIKILESMRSKSSDPVEAAKEDDDSDDTFNEDFKEDNL